MYFFVLDVGMGNPQSVVRMLEELEAQVKCVKHPDELYACLDEIVLVIPGVGTWDRGMNLLNEKGWVEFIQKNVSRFKLIIGICLGMQVFFNMSSEGTVQGLGIIDGDVAHLKETKVINIGWRDVKFKHDIGFSDSRFYHVHKFAVDKIDGKYIKGVEESGIIVCVAKENILGFQFHPEKSHFYGKLLFSEIVIKYA